jgi:ABC-2 type transport system permease protein
MNWRQVFLVAEFEFMQTAKRWQFLLVTLFLPLFMLFLFYISYVSGSFAEKKLGSQIKQGKKILVIDHSGYFDFSKSLLFESVDSVAPHASRLFSEKVIGLIEIPNDYMETGNIKLVSPKNRAIGLGRSLKGPVQKSLRAQLLKQITDKKQKQRIFSTVGFSVNILSKDGKVKPFDYHELVIPIFFLVIFILSISTASTFLLQSVSEEKEHRTIEILLSSLTDSGLITGKVIGLGSAALLQVLVWAVMGVVGLDRLSQQLGLPVSVSGIPTSHMIYGLIIMLLGFGLFASIMIGVGSIGANFKDAQQLSSFFLISSFLPVYVLQMILADIHGNVAVFLYYFPLTAPIVAITRFCIGNLSLAESVSGIVVLAVFTGLSIWCASKCFRLGCLIYNRRPTWKEIKSIF